MQVEPRSSPFRRLLPSSSRSGQGCLLPSCQEAGSVDGTADQEEQEADEPAQRGVACHGGRVRPECDQWIATKAGGERCRLGDQRPTDVLASDYVVDVVPDSEHRYQDDEPKQSGVVPPIRQYLLARVVGTGKHGFGSVTEHWSGRGGGGLRLRRRNAVHAEEQQQRDTSEGGCQRAGRSARGRWPSPDRRPLLSTVGVADSAVNPVE